MLDNVSRMLDNVSLKITHINCKLYGLKIHRNWLDNKYFTLQAEFKWDTFCQEIGQVADRAKEHQQALGVGMPYARVFLQACINRKVMAPTSIFLEYRIHTT